MLKQPSAILTLLLCAACGSSGTTSPPESLAAEAPASAAPKISGTCEALSPERAAQYQNASRPVGMIGRWTIAGVNGGPFCTEPYLDQTVECEMGAGDVVVLEGGGQVWAVENTYDGATSIRIAQQSLTCSPFIVE